MSWLLRLVKAGGKRVLQQRCWSGICLPALFIKVALLCMVFSLASLQASERRVISVAVDNSFPPYGYMENIDGERVFMGFNADILKAVSLATDHEIMIHPMSWESAVRALERGDVDAIAGMKYDRKREAKYDFSEGYMLNSLAIFVQKNTWDIQGLESLKGKKVAVYKNDVAYERLQELPLHLALTADEEEALQRLLKGEVDAVLGNRLTGEYLLQQMGRQSELKIVGGEIDRERYCLAVRKNDPLLGVLNQGLKLIQKNGIHERLHEKWFGQSMDGKSKNYRMYLNAVLVFSLVVVIVALVLMAFNFSLKKEVRKRVKEIERIRNYQNRLLNSGYGGILALDAAGEIKFANQYAEQCFSLEKGSLAGKAYDETDFPKLLGERDVLFPEAKVKEINDRHIEYTFRSFPVEDGAHETIIHFRDISLEYGLRQELARKDKMESLGKLLASVAHELRTPLTSIKAFVEMLPQKYDNPSFREKISQLVPQEVGRLDAIVNDLLAYSNPRPRIAEPVRFKPFIDKLLAYFEHLIKQEKIAISLDIQEDVVVFSDANHLQQILINVLMNAIQALAGGENPQLSIFTQSGDETGSLSIRDNGPGMKRETVEKAFEPFYSLRPGGTGLGLFISHELASSNKITMEILSEPGAGTEIRLSFSRA